MKRFAAAFAATVLLLTACGGAPTPTATPAPTATATPQPTATPEPTPTPSPTPEPTPTPLPEPTATPRPRPTPQPEAPSSQPALEGSDLLREEDLPEGFTFAGTSDGTVQFANRARQEVLSVGVIRAETEQEAEALSAVFADTDEVVDALELDFEEPPEAVKAWQRYGEQSFGYSGVVRINGNRQSADVLIVRVGTAFGILLYLYKPNAIPSVNMDYLGNLIAERLSALAGTVTPDTQRDTAESGERRYEREGGFSYVPPAGWQASDLGALRFKAMVAPRAVRGFTANLVFTEEAFSGSLSRYVDASLQQLKKLFPDLEVIETVKSGLRTNSGVPYALIIVERSEQGARLRQSLYIFDSGRRKITMTYTRLAESVEQAAYDNLVEETAASFRFEE
ncbi:MAG: hypothetical protein RMJ86_10150 [Anaerolineae bacterium]|nr:hypothetical protein [Anaerolineae bacterium]